MWERLETGRPGWMMTADVYFPRGSCRPSGPLSQISFRIRENTLWRRVPLSIFFIIPDTHPPFIPHPTMAKVETVVFLSLVLDLFAFTIPLPLFPRLIEWYTVVSCTHSTVHVLSNPHDIISHSEKSQIPTVSWPAPSNSSRPSDLCSINLVLSLNDGMSFFLADLWVPSFRQS